MTLDILRELESVGAVFTDKHFVYTTGKHGNAYINFDPLFPNVALVRQVCEALVAPFANDIDTVVAPAVGGIVLAVLGADALSRSGANVKAAWADKHEGSFVFERMGFQDQIRNKRVLVVEDLLNTGGSVAKVCKLVVAHGGELIGASVIVNRGASTAQSLAVPRLEALAKVEMSAYEASTCPLCDQHVPIVTDVGHGAEYRQSHASYDGGFTTVS